MTTKNGALRADRLRKHLRLGVSVAAACVAAVVTISQDPSRAAAAPQSAGSATPAVARRIMDGLYSEAQAARGKEAYTKACARCHMPDLGGHDYAGPLAGFGFRLKWQDASLAEVLGRMRGMPLDRPGSLADQEYVDILAYMLHTNEYPAGAGELTFALAAQRWPRILIERLPSDKPRF